MGTAEHDFTTWEKIFLVKVQSGSLTTGQATSFTHYVNNIMSSDLLPSPYQSMTQLFLEEFVPDVIYEVLHYHQAISRYNKLLLVLIPLFVKNLNQTRSKFVRACFSIVLSPEYPFYTSKTKYNKTTKLYEYPLYKKNIKAFANAAPFPKINQLLRKSYYPPLTDVLFAIVPYAKPEDIKNTVEILIASLMRYLETLDDAETLDEDRFAQLLMRLLQLNTPYERLDDLKLCFALRLFECESDAKKVHSIHFVNEVFQNATVERKVLLGNHLVNSKFWNAADMVSIGEFARTQESSQVLIDLVGICELLMRYEFVTRDELLQLWNVFTNEKGYDMSPFFNRFAIIYFGFSDLEKSSFWCLVLKSHIDSSVLSFIDEVAACTPYSDRVRIFDSLVARLNDDDLDMGDIAQALYTLAIDEPAFIQRITDQCFQLIGSHAPSKVTIPMLKAVGKYSNERRIFDAIIDVGMPPLFANLVPDLIKRFGGVITEAEFNKLINLPFQLVIANCLPDDLDPQKLLVYFLQLPLTADTKVVIRIFRIMNSQQTIPHRMNGINRLWDFAFATAEIHPFLVELYTKHSGSPDEIQDFVERCAHRLNQRNSLLLLDMIIHRLEGGIDKESFGIQANRFREDMINVRLIGQLEGVLAIKRGTSTSQLEQQIAESLGVDTSAIMITRNGRELNDGIVGSASTFDVAIDPLVDDQSYLRVNAQYLPSRILKKYFYRLFPMLRGPDASIAYSILNEMEMSEEEHDLIDSEQSLEYTLDAPYLLLYRLNILARMLDDPASDFTRDFVKSGEAQKLFDFIFASHDMYPDHQAFLLSIIRVLMPLENFFTQANVDNALDWANEADDSGIQSDVIAIISRAPIDLVSAAKSFTVMIIDHLFSEDERKRVAAVGVMEKSHVDLRPYIENAIYKPCSEYFHFIAQQHLDADFLNQLVELVYSVYSPRGEIIDELEEKMPSPEFTEGVTHLILTLQNSYPIPNEPKFFTFLVDRLLYNPFKNIYLPAKFYNLLEVILMRNISLSSQLRIPKMARKKHFSHKYGAIRLMAKTPDVVQYCLSNCDGINPEIHEAVLMEHFVPGSIKIDDDAKPIFDKFPIFRGKYLKNYKAAEFIFLPVGHIILEAPQLAVVETRDPQPHMTITMGDKRILPYDLVSADAPYAIYRTGTIAAPRPDDLFVQKVASNIIQFSIHQKLHSREFKRFLEFVIDIGTQKLVYKLFGQISAVPDSVRLRLIERVGSFLTSQKAAQSVLRNTKRAARHCLKSKNKNERIAYANLLINSMILTNTTDKYLSWLRSADVQDLAFDEFLIPYVWICQHNPDIDSSRIETLLDEYPNRPLSHAFEALKILGRRTSFDLEFFSKHLNQTANLEAFYDFAIPSFAEDLSANWRAVKAAKLPPPVAAGFWAMAAVTGRVKHWAILKYYSNEQIAEFFDALKDRLRTDITEFWLSTRDQWASSFLCTNTEISEPFIQVVQVSCDPGKLILPLWSYLAVPRQQPLDDFFTLLEWCVTKANDPHEIIKNNKVILLGAVRFIDDQTRMQLLTFLGNVIGPLGSKYFFKSAHFFRQFLVLIGQSFYTTPNARDAALNLISLVVPEFSGVFIKSQHFKLIARNCFDTCGAELRSLIEQNASWSTSKTIAKVLWSSSVFEAGKTLVDYLKTSIFIVNNYPHTGKSFKARELDLAGDITIPEQLDLLTEYIKTLEKPKQFDIGVYMPVFPKLQDMPAAVLRLMIAIVKLDPDTIDVIQSSTGGSLMQHYQIIESVNLLCLIARTRSSATQLAHELALVGTTRYDLIEPMCDCLVYLEDRQTCLPAMERLILTKSPQVFVGRCRALLIELCKSDIGLTPRLLEECEKQMEEEVRELLQTGQRDLLVGIKERLEFIYRVMKELNVVGPRVKLTTDEQKHLAEICDDETDVHLKDCAALIFHLYS